jgi:hypothetical protein
MFNIIDYVNITPNTTTTDTNITKSSSNSYTLRNIVYYIV